MTARCDPYKFASPAIPFAARSHTGRVRGNNEDNLYCDGAVLSPEAREAPFVLQGEACLPCLFAVCDGMGGEASGEVASLIAVTALREHAERIARAASRGGPDAAVQEFVSDANERLCAAMRENATRMGTTLALVVVADGALWPYNIGDSRVYALGETFARVSEEHTLAEQKMRMGFITPEEAERHPSRHILTRHLGTFEDEMTLTAATPGPIVLEGLTGQARACRVLLCSDGLTDMVEETRIEAILRAERSPTDAADALLREALENGGRDNVTCLVADVAI